jgi:hypothetical protein
LNISGKNMAQNQERIDYFVDCYFKNNYPHILFEIQSQSQKEGTHEKKIEEIKHNPHKLAAYHQKRQQENDEYYNTFLAQYTKVPLWIEFKELFDRVHLQAQREAAMSEGKVLISLIISLFILAIFWGSGYSTYTEQQDQLGCLFVVVNMQLQIHFFSTIDIFQNERPCFLREYAN